MDKKTRNFIILAIVVFSLIIISGGTALFFVSKSCDIDFLKRSKSVTSSIDVDKSSGALIKGFLSGHRELLFFYSPEDFLYKSSMCAAFYKNDPNYKTLLDIFATKDNEKTNFAELIAKFFNAAKYFYVSTAKGSKDYNLVSLPDDKLFNLNKKKKKKEETAEGPDDANKLKTAEGDPKTNEPIKEESKPDDPVQNPNDGENVVKQPMDLSNLFYIFSMIRMKGTVKIGLKFINHGFFNTFPFWNIRSKISTFYREIPTLFKLLVNEKETSMIKINIKEEKTFEIMFVGSKQSKTLTCTFPKSEHADINDIAGHLLYHLFNALFLELKTGYIKEANATSSSDAPPTTQK